MQNVLEEIKTSPGVMGACVFSAERGVLASNLPTVFNPETQKRIAAILHRIFRLNETVKLDINSYEIQYDEALLLVKSLCDASSLIVICEPDANIHLVNMAIGVLSSDLAAMLDECRTAPAAEQPQEAVDAETVITRLMADQMAVIRKALAKCIGPIAAMTLESKVEAWLEKGAPAGERLAELAGDLLTEIDNPQDQKEFMEDLKEIL